MSPLKQRIPAEARDGNGHKRCYGCEKWLPENQFSRSSGKKDGLQPRCKKCAKAIYDHTAAEVRAANRKGKYGLSPHQFQKLLESQGGGCAICGSASPGSRFWAVDHDHGCCPGKSSCGSCVRGILCGSCNVGLGSFKDNVEALRRAADYLDHAEVRRSFFLSDDEPPF